jgi:hypothetical protein
LRALDAVQRFQAEVDAVLGREVAGLPKAVDDLPVLDLQRV